MPAPEAIAYRSCASRPGPGCQLIYFGFSDMHGPLKNKGAQISLLTFFRLQHLPPFSSFDSYAQRDK
jgi:hypothetical protein